MGALCSSETSVPTYQTTGCSNWKTCPLVCCFVGLRRTYSSVAGILRVTDGCFEATRAAYLGGIAKLVSSSPGIRCSSRVALLREGNPNFVTLSHTEPHRHTTSERASAAANPGQQSTDPAALRTQYLGPDTAVHCQSMCYCYFCSW